jgi:peptidoglycan/LPS O-acetylase OafA/YrhL
VTLAQRATGRDNNFDVLRLVAAAMVLVSHSYTLTATPGYVQQFGSTEPYAQLTGDTLGAVGVSIFFAISGFLIARSWTLTPRAGTFAVKRGLRLLPAVVVAAVLCAFVLGPIATTLPVGAYLSSSSPYLYVVKNLGLFEHGLTLPGVFPLNDVRFAINGSLWTLPVEAACYVLAAALGIAALLRRPRALALLAIACLIVASPIVNIDSVLRGLRGDSGLTFDVTTLVRLVACFVLGAWFWAARDRIVLRWAYLVPLLALWALSWNSDWQAVTASLAIAYLVLLVAYCTPRALRALVRPGDVSYGLYIYAFPVQQLIEWRFLSHGQNISAGAMMALAFPLTYVVALASWRLVEVPALELKKRLR